MREDQLQALLFAHHWNHYPQERGRLFHINQKSRDAREGNRMKAMGVMPGVSDMVYLLPGTVLWIELKTEDGVQSKEQRMFQARVELFGMRYVIVRSLPEFLKVIGKM